MTRRELACVGVASVVLAVIMTWPLSANLSTAITKELSDPLEQVWITAWGGHALIHQPHRLFQANIFWPHADTLAFSDPLIGFAPFSLLGAGAKAALVRFNLLCLFAYALAFIGAYLLARELGASALPSALAGAAFAYAPWRIDQSIHIQVLSSGGIPLSLFLLLRGHRRRSPRMILAGWLVAAWQISLGFGIGLQFVYLLGILVVLAIAFWIHQGRPRVERRVIVSTSAGLIIFLACGALLAVPYLRVAGDHPEAVQGKRQFLNEFSPPLRGFLAASEDNVIWGRPTRAIRDTLSWPPEQAIFPGLAVLALAGFGLFAKPWSKGLRLGLGAGILITAIFSLGVSVAGGRFSYLVLYNFAPGWRAVRTPGRIVTLTTLGLALLAAAGASGLMGRWRRALVSRGARKSLVAVPAAAILLIGFVLLEGSGRRSLVSVPSVPPGQMGAPSPQVHLPIGVPDPIYMYWSLEDFAPLVNGYASFYPAGSRAIQSQMASFPDVGSISALQSLGVKAVILHPDLAVGTPWQTTANKSVAGLPLARLETGGVVLYYLLD